MVQTKLNKITEGVKKRRRVSKKTKKSWRKHVDTTDVDKFLDDKRLEERLGTPFAIRSDNELFKVDCTPINPEIITEINSKAAYRQALRNSEPHCYASLKPHTAVPDPISKRNRVRSREERKNPVVRKIQLARKLNGQIKLKERKAENDKLLAEIKRKERPKRGNFNLDVWSVTSKDLDEINPEWLTSDTVRHTLANKGLRKRKIPTSLHKKPSAVSAIEMPHPGMSYNPSYEDHQQLLHEVAEKEKKLMKEEAHLNRVTIKMFKKVTPEQQNKNWMTESSEGLPLNENNKPTKSEADDNDDPNVKSVNPPVKNAKKTLVKRRKQREQKQLAYELKKKKTEKKKIGDLYKLRFLKKNIETKEKKHKVLRDIREKVKAIKSLEPKVLSRTKFEPPEVDFKMGEELSGNLRNSDPTGNLLKDRYKSLQQRNIVAPSARVLKRNKPNVKKYIKADHKITLPSKSK